MKTFTREQIQDLLMEEGERGMHAVGRALAALLRRQTVDEQSQECTKYQNGMGFTSSDAGIGTSMAQFYLAHGYLTQKQVAYWRKPGKKSGPKITKYASQLLLVAKERAAQRNSENAKESS